MNYYTVVKRYYGMGYYTDEQVRKFAENGKITEAQYTEITGNPYNAPAPVETTE